MPGERKFFDIGNTVCLTTKLNSNSISMTKCMNSQTNLSNLNNQSRKEATNIVVKDRDFFQAMTVLVQ